MNLRVVKENCHKDCKLTTLHSTCFMASRLRTPVMAQMLHKVETLPEKKQNQKRLSQYAGIEVLLKEKK